jgi:transcriptional regulator with XRE-family HTH domain
VDILIDISERIGERIRELRQRVGLTQKELACGIISQAQISKIEKGEVTPLSTTLFELSERLGVNVNVIYEYAYNHRCTHISEVKKQIRKAIRSRNYQQVSSIVKLAINNNSFKNPKEQKFLLWHKGVSDYYLRGDIKNSLTILHNALNIEKKSELYYLLDVEILNSIGILYNEVSEYEKSINIYFQAFEKLKSLLEINDYSVYTRLCYGTAKSFFKLQEYQKSLTYSKNGIDTCIREESLYLLGELYYECGQNYYGMNQLKLAYDSFKKAANVFEIENKLIFLEATKRKIDEIL